MQAAPVSDSHLRLQNLPLSLLIIAHSLPTTFMPPFLETASLKSGRVFYKVLVKAAEF